MVQFFDSLCRCRPSCRLDVISNIIGQVHPHMTRIMTVCYKLLNSSTDVDCTNLVLSLLLCKLDEIVEN